MLELRSLHNLHVGLHQSDVFLLCEESTWETGDAVSLGLMTLTIKWISCEQMNGADDAVINLAPVAGISANVPGSSDVTDPYQYG